MRILYLFFIIGLVLTDKVVDETILHRVGLGKIKVKDFYTVHFIQIHHLYSVNPENSVRFEKKQFVRWRLSWMVWISRCEIFRRNRTIWLSKISWSRFLAGLDRKTNIFYVVIAMVRLWSDKGWLWCNRIQIKLSKWIRKW